MLRGPDEDWLLLIHSSMAARSNKDKSSQFITPHSLKRLVSKLSTPVPDPITRRTSGISGNGVVDGEEVESLSELPGEGSRCGVTGVLSAFEVMIGLD